MKFVGAEPDEKDLSSPYNMVRFFLKANYSYQTQYKDNGPKHYPGRNRSITELLQYCKQYGFTREQIMPEIPKLCGVMHCPDINKYVLISTKKYSNLYANAYSRKIAKEMGLKPKRW